MTVPALSVVDDVLAVVASAQEIDAAGDFLNADRFLSEHRNRVKWSPEMGQWFVWNGAWWEQDRLELAQELAKATVDGLRSWVGEAKDRDQFKQRSRHYEASTRSGRRDGLLAIARTDRSIVVAVKQLDQAPHLLACRNGTVNLRTGELLPADPALLITRGVDLDYDPDAFSELWQQFLETVLDGNAETIAYLQTLMGYCITGEVGEHLLPDFYGLGANGKSTFITAITGVLPSMRPSRQRASSSSRSMNNIRNDSPCCEGAGLWSAWSSRGAPLWPRAW
jgi:putative DNA primase/helicase